MILTFTLPGQCLSGKNGMQVTRQGRHYPKPRWAAWRDEMVLQVNAAIRHQIGRLPRTWTALDGPCKAHVVFRHGDHLRRDVPGMIDALCHVLERAGVVKDDSLITDWDISTSSVIHAKPGVWIRLETEWVRTA